MVSPSLSCSSKFCRKLAESQESVARAVDPFLALKNHVDIIAVIGLALFYGMDRMVKTSRQRRREQGAKDHTSDGVFWLRMGVVATKNHTGAAKPLLGVCTCLVVYGGLLLVQ